MIRAAAAVLIFVGLSLLSVAVLNEGGTGGLWFAVAVQALGCLVAGAMLHEQVWIAAALALGPAVLAGPFGDAENLRGEGLPLVLFELLLFPAYVGLIAAGWAARRAIERRRSRIRPQRSS